MTACLHDLANMWHRQAWRAHADGRTETAQTLRRCADQLTAALERDNTDDEIHETAAPWPGELKPRRR